MPLVTVTVREVRARLDRQFDRWRRCFVWARDAVTPCHHAATCALHRRAARRDVAGLENRLSSSCLGARMGSASRSGFCSLCIFLCHSMFWASWFLFQFLPFDFFMFISPDYYLLCLFDRTFALSLFLWNSVLSLLRVVYLYSLVPLDSVLSNLNYLFYSFVLLCVPIVRRERVSWLMLCFRRSHGSRDRTFLVQPLEPTCRPVASAQLDVRLRKKTFSATLGGTPLASSPI